MKTEKASMLPAAVATATSVHPSFWKATFEEHGGAVLAFLMSRVGRREVGEDLLQETFVRAMRSGALRDLSKARSYLFSIAYRLVVDHVRKRRPVLFTEILAEDAVGNLTDEREPSVHQSSARSVSRRRRRRSTRGHRILAQQSFGTAGRRTT